MDEKGDLNPVVSTVEGAKRYNTTKWAVLARTASAQEPSSWNVVADLVAEHVILQQASGAA